MWSPSQRLQCRLQPLSNHPATRSLQYEYSQSTETAKLKSEAINVEHAEALPESPATLSTMFALSKGMPLSEVQNNLLAVYLSFVWRHLWLADSRNRSSNPATSEIKPLTAQSAGWVLKEMPRHRKRFLEEEQWRMLNDNDGNKPHFRIQGPFRGIF